MATEQFRSFLPGGPEAQQEQNSVNQANSPNAAGTNPTPATLPTEATLPQDNNNPANNGIVPWGAYGYEDRSLWGTKQVGATGTDINTSIKNQSMTTQPADTTLAKLYGIQQSGLTPEDTAKLPTGVYDSTGKYLEKTVQSFYMTPKTSKAYGDLQNDFNMITVPGKQANSGKWIDPNFWVNLEQTWSILWKIAGSDAYKVKALANERTVLDTATQNFLNLKQQASNLPEDQKASMMQDAVAQLKMAMIPFAEKARAIEFGKYGTRTELSDSMDTFMNGMRKFQEIYKSDETQLKDFLGTATKSFSKANVEYKQLKDLPSLNAKKELMDNPAYQTFLDSIVKNVPEIADKINTFKNSSVITPDESDFIKKYFVGKYAAQLFDARKAAIAALWPVNWAAMFKWFDAIIKIKDLPYQTREDDLLDTANLGQLDYSLNSGEGYQFSWSSYTPTWQTGWQSYNVRQVSTRSVNRSIW